jgi:EmrB/QacA subfamily drug resistance transporter
MTMQLPTEQSPLLAPQSDSEISSDGQNGKASDTGDSTSNDLSSLQLSIILLGPFLSAFVAALDSSMVATLSSPIASSFGALSNLSWLASAFFIANAATQPLSGKLTDIYGRRSGMILANVVFALGNVMCGFAKSEGVMIAGRIVAGLGGGGVMAIPTFILSDIVPLRNRGIWQGIGNMTQGVGSGIGAVLAGWISDKLDWRATFLIQIPISVVAILWIWFTVHILTVGNDKSQSRLRRIDFLGSVSLFMTLVMLLLGMSSGGKTAAWNDPLVLVCLPLSLVSATIFIVVELKHAKEPIIPLTLLWDRSVASGCLTNFLSSGSRFAMLFYLPMFLEVQGYNSTQVGLRLIPSSIGGAVASLASGIFVKKTGRFYNLGIAAQLTFLTGLIFTCTFNLQTPAWPPFVWYAVLNIGYGMMLTATILALLSSVEFKDLAVITSALFAFRSTGTVLGISLAGFIFQHVLRKLLWDKLGDIENAEEMIDGFIDNFKAIDSVDKMLQDHVLQAYMGALRAVFLLLMGMGALALVTTCFIKDRELSTKVTRKPASEEN